MSSKGLLAAGETVLPDNEQIVRGLALYPKRDRQLIWKRARQIADRNSEKPNYKTIRNAALDIVPTEKTSGLAMMLLGLIPGEPASACVPQPIRRRPATRFPAPT